MLILFELLLWGGNGIFSMRLGSEAVTFTILPF
jgi:hypothetical protein